MREKSNLLRLPILIVLLGVLSKFVGTWKSDVVPYTNQLDTLVYQGMSCEAKIWCAERDSEATFEWDPVMHGTYVRKEHLQKGVGGAVVWLVSDTLPEQH